MADRFDLQLVSGELLDGEGLDYIADSFRVFGNDGSHTLGQAIDTGTGASPGVLSALMDASDHLAGGGGLRGAGALTSSLTFDSNFNYLTDVGAYTNSVSPFGTFDQSGNVWEWNESLIFGAERGIRGGSWGNGANFLPASWRGSGGPTFHNTNIGFRVVSRVATDPPLGGAIHEPATMFLAALGGAAVLGCCRRRRAA